MRSRTDLLKDKYERLCSLLPLLPHPSQRTLQFTPQHDGSAHVELVGDLYNYVVTERGSEYERKSTRDEDELLYWLFADVTFSLASDFEVRHRISGQDSRRQLFSKQVELLGLLRPAWAEREQKEHERIIAEHPFQDDLKT
jgi:hypothetical protein